MFTQAQAARKAAAHNRRRAATERLGVALAAACAAVSACAVLAVFAFLAWFTWPMLFSGGLAEVMSPVWRPFGGRFGILPMVAGSVALSVSAMLLAYPLGIGVCLFVHGAGPKRLAGPVMGLVRFMTSVPTVVYGFVAVFLLVPAVRTGFAGGSGFCWLSACLVLALLALPTVVLVLHSQMQAVEPRVRLTAAALGLTTSQKLTRLVLPMSRRGMLAAAALGFGRAVGDTLVPLMLAGNAAQFPGSPLDSVRTLTAHVALVVATDSGSLAYSSLFASGMILFLTAAGVNVWLRSLGRGRNGAGGLGGHHA